jgi:hypothetical protein
MKNRPSQKSTGFALSLIFAVPMFLLAAHVSAQDSRHSGGAGPAGNSGGGSGAAAGVGPSGSGTVSVSSGGSSTGSSGGGSSSDFGSSSSGSSFSGGGSGPSGVRGGGFAARDGATGGGGVAVGRAVHGADTSSYRTGGGAIFSDHTAGRVMGTDPATRNADIGNVPAHSRPRDGATVSGTAVPRGSVPSQPTSPGGGVSYINGGNAYGYYGVGYGFGYSSCDPFGFNASVTSNYYSCSRPYGYGSMYYDPFYASTMMGAFSADPWYGGSSSGSSSSTWTPDSPEDATLRLKIKPSQAEVYVDGYFVGVVNDFDGMFQKMHLEAGPHRIEVRAPGYETLDIDIRLNSGKTTVYQGELTKIQ